MKRIIKAASILFLLGIVFAAGLLIKRNYEQAEWDFYIRHFNYVETGNDAIIVYGEPKEREYSYDKNNESKVICTLLHYDGFSFGILGSEKENICMLSIDHPGLLPLRNGIDIGSTRAQVEAAYWDTPISKEGDAYYLKHKNEIAWEGIWVFPIYDENDILVHFDVTNGL